MDIPWTNQTSESGAGFYDVKIFGERNSGTNVLRRLVEANSEARVLPSVISEVSPSWHFFSRAISYPSLKERLIDYGFSTQSPSHYWKHCALAAEDCKYFSGISVVFIVRHPLSWSLSMERRPYHLLPVRKVTGKLNFLRQKFRLLRRDRLGRGDITIPELWNQKVGSYITSSDQLVKAGIPSIVVKFEDLLTSQIEFFRELGGRVCIGRHTNRFHEIHESTKNGGKNFLEIRERELSGAFRLSAVERFGKEELKKFDRELMDVLDYQ